MFADSSSSGPIFGKNPSTYSRRDARRARKRGGPSAESCVRCLLLFSRTTGSGMPPKGERSYRTSFPKATARFVSSELTMENRLATKQSKRVRVKTQYVKPDGNLLVMQEEEMVVHPDTQQSWYQWGIGGQNPGYWQPGKYRVAIFIDGVEFAEESFTITAAGGMPEYEA